MALSWQYAAPANTYAVPQENSPEVSRLKDEVAFVQNRREAMRVEMSRMADRIERLRDDRDALDRDLMASKERTRGRERELDDATHRLENVRARLHVLKTAAEYHENQVSQADRKVRSASRELSRVDAELTRTKLDKERYAKTISSMRSELEKYERRVRRLEEEKNQLIVENVELRATAPPPPPPSVAPVAPAVVSELLVAVPEPPVVFGVTGPACASPQQGVQSTGGSVAATQVLDNADGKQAKSNDEVDTEKLSDGEVSDESEYADADTENSFPMPFHSSPLRVRAPSKEIAEEAKLVARVNAEDRAVAERVDAKSQIVETGANLAAIPVAVASDIKRDVASVNVAAVATSDVSSVVKPKRKAVAEPSRRRELTGLASQVNYESGRDKRRKIQPTTAKKVRRARA
jgi:hypothetical protein